jgi:hypothetical protein
VGSSVKLFGLNGSVQSKILGAVLPIISCILGDFLSNVGFLAASESINYFEILFSINYSYFFEIAFLDIDPLSLLFYGIAAFEGYKINDL